MRKWLACVCAFALLAGVPAGCAVGGIADTAAEVRIGLDMATRDDFLTSMENAAVRAAGDAEVSLEVANANNDQSVQLAQIEEWAADGYAAAIVVLCEADAAADVLARAGTMPVVFVNRQPDDLTVLQSRNNVIYIGCPEEDAGRMQGEFLAAYFQAQELDTPRIAVLAGDRKTNASSGRLDAAKEALREDGLAPLYILEVRGEWDRAKARERLAQELKNKPEIDAVLAANDAMALGAADALAQAGYAVTGIPIVSVDATEDGRAAIRDGRLSFSAFQDPVAQGAGAVEAAVRMLEGGMPEGVQDSVLWVPYQPVHAGNVDRLFPDDR